MMAYPLKPKRQQKSHDELGTSTRYLSLHPSIHLSCLSVCLSVCLSLPLAVFQRARARWNTSTNRRIDGFGLQICQSTDLTFNISTCKGLDNFNNVFFENSESEYDAAQKQAKVIIDEVEKHGVL